MIEISPRGSLFGHDRGDRQLGVGAAVGQAEDLVARGELAYAGAYLVYSSVANADRQTGVPHFDSKFAVEEHIRTRGIEAAILAPVYFMENGLSDFGILEALLHKGPMLVNEIGRRIQLTSGSITTAVDRLEARGLIERSADAGDRRAQKVSLTRSGRGLITRIFDKHKADLDAAADGLTRAERETLIALLKKLGMTADASSV